MRNIDKQPSDSQNPESLFGDLKRVKCPGEGYYVPDHETLDQFPELTTEQSLVVKIAYKGGIGPRYFVVPSLESIQKIRSLFSITDIMAESPTFLAIQTEKLEAA